MTVARSSSTSIQTLLRQHALTLERYRNQIPFSAQLALVKSAQGRDKYELILESEDPERLVTALAPQDIFLLARSLGLEDVPELIRFMSAEQFGAMLDLDGWRDEELQPERLILWLTQLYDGGEERALTMLRELDFESLALIFSRLVRVVHGPEEIDDEEIRFEMVTRNGGYALEYAFPEHARVLAGLLDLLFHCDQELYLRLLEAVRWESGAILEEEGYRLHCQRLNELGIPAPHEAATVYARCVPETFAPATAKIPLGGIGQLVPSFSRDAAGRGLLATVMAQAASAGLEWELACLTNKVMVANHVDVGESEQVRAALQEVAQTLDLALSHQCGGDLQAALELCRTRYLEELFRLGATLLAQRREQARRLLAAPDIIFLDGPYRACLDHLSQRPPRLCLPTAAGRIVPKAIDSLADLATADEWLSRIATLFTLFSDHLPFPLPTDESLPLDGCVPGTLAEVTFSDIFLTALANRLLGRDFTPEPIAAEELDELHRRIRRNGALADEIREQSFARLEEFLPGSGDFALWALEIWNDGLCAQSADELDPRHLDGLIVRLPRRR